MVKYLKGRNAPMNDLEGGVNVDSDCEGDLAGAGDGASNEEQNEEETRAVLITGSFSAYVRFSPHSDAGRNNGSPSWKSLFFYRCTDVISFAPLKSQGIEPRLDYIRQQTTADAPPPCSPKSIYALASLVSRPSIEFLRHETNASDQARNPTPL